MNIRIAEIEDAFKEVCKICSNIIIIGDYRKYLSAFITLKTDSEGRFPKDVLDDLKQLGSDAANIIEAINDAKVKVYLEKCLEISSPTSCMT